MSGWLKLLGHKIASPSPINRLRHQDISMKRHWRCERPHLEGERMVNGFLAVEKNRPVHTGWELSSIIDATTSG